MEILAVLMQVFTLDSLLLVLWAVTMASLVVFLILILAILLLAFTMMMDKNK